MRASLTLVQWLSTVSDFGGMCSMCGEYGFSVIEIVEPTMGLVYDNVVPVCRACHHHRKHGIENAEDRIRAYLDNEDREPHAIKPDASMYELQEYTGYEGAYLD